MNISKASIPDKLNFTKKLVANAAVAKNSAAYPCSIYRLEYETDWDYFYKQNKSWQKANYLEPIEARLECKKPCGFYYGDSDIYVIENQKGKCLGYCENDSYKDANVLLTLETYPLYTAKNKDRRIKYIGETLLAFLAGLSKQEHKASLNVHSAVPSAMNFYTEKCGFDISKGKSPTLSEDKFDALIAQNENHTKGKIQYREK